MKIGLLFGSFNPIHIGHTALANYFVEFTNIDEVWFVVSPQNPFKDKAELLPDLDRLKMVKLVIQDEVRFKVSDVEFDLEQPSYTIDTLDCLKDKYSEDSFTVLMGSDNLQFIHLWKDYQRLLDEYDIMVYPRPGTVMDNLKIYKNVSIIEAPLLDISSTFIRDSFHQGKDVRHFMHPSVFKYLQSHELLSTIQ